MAETRTRPPAFVINLERSTKRRRKVLAALEAVPAIEPRIFKAVDGSAANFGPEREPLLRGVRPKHPGTFACFLSHFRVWETILREEIRGAFVFEDDIEVIGRFEPFLSAEKPEADIFFVNGRAAAQLGLGDWEGPLQSLDAVYRYNRTHFPEKALPRAAGGVLPAIGGDGYFLTLSGAERLVSVILDHGIHGHLDLFLMTIATRGETLSAVTNPGYVDRLLRRYPVERCGLGAYIWTQPIVDAEQSNDRSVRKMGDQRRSVTPASDGRTLHAALAEIPTHKLPQITDFTLSDTADRPEADLRNAIPYAHSIDTRQMLCTLHENPHDLLAAPFFYVAQRKDARQAAWFSWDKLQENYGVPSRGLDPILIFSLGRTGSTLLDDLLGCVVPCAVSEPDAITQLAVSGTRFRSLPADLRRQLIWYSLAPFLRLAGDSDCSLKFRSQVNRIAGEVARTLPAARYVFMTRERRSWAISTWRSFRLPPEKAAARLVEGAQALTALRTAGVRLTAVTYENIVADPAGELGRILQREGFDAEQARRIAAVMDRDPQAGTPIGRSSARAAMTPDRTWMDSFEAECRRLGVSAMYGELGLELDG